MRRRLIAAVRNNTDNTNTNSIKITRKQKWEEKSVWTFQAKNKRNFTGVNLDMTKKKKT